MSQPAKPQHALKWSLMKAQKSADMLQSRHYLCLLHSLQGWGITCGAGEACGS